MNLEQNLRVTYFDIEAQIRVIKEQAEARGIEPTQMMYADGTHCLVPLLLAKAQILNGLAVLKGSPPKL